MAEGRTPRSARTGGGAIAVLLVAALAGCSTPGGSPAIDRTGSGAPAASRTAAPETVTEGGVELTRAGSSPFIGAVSGADSARDLVVQITRLPSDPPFPVCTGVRWRPLLRETADAVTVTAVAYAPKEGSGQCVDGLDATVPLEVRLSRPLGDRRLIDGSDGREHAVFDDARMPVPAESTMPDGVEEQPVRWDETSRTALQRWRSPEGTAERAAHDVWISLGPAAGIAAGAPVPSRTSAAAAIGDEAGRVWHGGGPFDVVVVRFPRGSDVVEVRTVQAKGEQGTVESALAIARSLV